MGQSSLKCISLLVEMQKSSGVDFIKNTPTLIKNHKTHLRKCGNIVVFHKTTCTYNKSYVTTIDFSFKSLKVQNILSKSVLHSQ